MGHPFSTKQGLTSEASAGLLLIGATLLALMFSNTALDELYRALFDYKISVGTESFGIAKPLLLWINDGLMAIFFLFVGLELKREVLEGELSDRRTASLPLYAALGGLIVPALIYVGLNAGNSDALRGWAIPAATDIAFALGVLALLGSRVPITLKIFLLAVAIVDDLAAIIIIAVFYTSAISPGPLGLAVAGGLVLYAFNRADVRSVAPYLLVGAILWVCLLKSGVHATLAGVVTALFIPNVHANSEQEGDTVLVQLEHTLKPYVLLVIMPIFAFANAGVSLGGLTMNDVFAPVALGISAGLFIGKQIGILGASWIAIRSGAAQLPAGVTWAQMHGVALLAGIGFTMSLFIGSLAFPDGPEATSVRLGVLIGSLLSAVAGYLLLRRSLQPAAA